MANNNLLTIMQSKHKTPWEFNFDNMFARPLLSYLTIGDIEGLKRIATSVRLSSKIKEKQKLIGNIMAARGFRRFAGGTNRIVFASYEDPSILIKVAVDRTGMNDNPDELRAQQFIKPFCSKMFEVSPCGTVGLCERVIPITNKEQFKQVADDVFEIIVRRIVGRYVMDDIGTDYFLNWGIRAGFGPVLVDFPYLYSTDGDKLYCNKILETGMRCSGEIDYDAGFNHLYCQKCGKQYKAIDLKSDVDNNKIIIGESLNGGDTMIVKAITDNGVKILGEEQHAVMRPRRKKRFGGLMIDDNDMNIAMNREKEATKVEQEEKNTTVISSSTIQIPDGFELDSEEDIEEDSTESVDEKDGKSKELIGNQTAVDNVDNDQESNFISSEEANSLIANAEECRAVENENYVDEDYIENTTADSGYNGNAIKTVRHPTYISKGGKFTINKNPVQASKDNGLSVQRKIKY